MTLDELAALVRQMRQAQNEYFRERSPQYLNLSKELERRVDRAVADILDKQGTLFGKDG
jgi:arsenate reductase-like glutaredoxin family protein